MNTAKFFKKFSKKETINVENATHIKLIKRRINKNKNKKKENK